MTRTEESLRSAIYHMEYAAQRLRDVGRTMDAYDIDDMLESARAALQRMTDVTRSATQDGDTAQE